MAADQKIKYSVQEMFNMCLDTLFNILQFEPVEYDGANLKRKTSDLVATKVTVDGDVTYVAKAPVGTAQSAEAWQCKKIDETTGVVITWADGDSDFNNIATDLTALDYS